MYEATYFSRDGGWHYAYYPDNDHTSEPWNSELTEKALFESVSYYKKNSNRKKIKMTTIKVGEKVYEIPPESTIQVERDGLMLLGEVSSSGGGFLNLNTELFSTFRPGDELVKVFKAQDSKDFEVDSTDYVTSLLEQQSAGTVICAFDKKTKVRGSDMTFFKTYGSEDNRWVDVFNANFSSETIAQTIIEETDLKFYFMALHGSTSSGDEEITF